MKIVFATHNPNKLKEIQNVLPQYEVVGLDELNLTEDIPEPFETLEENAMAKASYIFKNHGLACFSDDSGLEVESLNGEPGVHSAHYAGPQRSDEDNMNLLLGNLEKHGNNVSRQAQFRTVVAYMAPGVSKTFEGIAPGQITQEKRGEQGFGYDPIFIPEGETRTFAQMSLEEKGQISHRKRAIAKFIQWLESDQKS
ncbi:MAG: non-canonical purine NTP diphosphatase [Schleiferiaceae bacterium]